MSDVAPAAVATSSDKRSARPTKRRALSPVSQQAQAVAQLLANPDREIKIPTGQSKTRSLPPPPEIVANVQGSSAGAGSGEFHVYKASRRREYERLRLMDEEVRLEEEAREYREKMEKLRKLDEEKTNKNRKRRMKKKGKAGGKKDEDGKDADGKPEGETLSGSAASEKREREDKEEELAAPVVEEVGVVIHDDDD